MPEGIALQKELESVVVHGDFIMNMYGSADEEAQDYKPDYAYGLPVYEDNDNLAAIEFDTTADRLHQLESEAATDLLLPNSAAYTVCFAFIPRRYSFPPVHSDDSLVGEALTLNLVHNNGINGTYAVWRDMATGMYITEAFVAPEGVNQVDVVITSLACNALHRLLDCVPRIADH